MEKIKENCKKLGVTVNSYMVTKYMKDYSGRQKLAIPISIREDDRSISCMVSSVIAYAEYDSNASFEENLVKINKILDLFSIVPYFLAVLIAARTVSQDCSESAA